MNAYILVIQTRSGKAFRGQFAFVIQISYEIAHITYRPWNGTCGAVFFSTALEIKEGIFFKAQVFIALNSGICAAEYIMVRLDSCHEEAYKLVCLLLLVLSHIHEVTKIWTQPIFSYYLKIINIFLGNSQHFSGLKQRFPWFSWVRCIVVFVKLLWKFLEHF